MSKTCVDFGSFYDICDYLDYLHGLKKRLTPHDLAVAVNSLLEPESIDGILRDVGYNDAGWDDKFRARGWLYESVGILKEARAAEKKADKSRCLDYASDAMPPERGPRPVTGFTDSAMVEVFKDSLLSLPYDRLDFFCSSIMLRKRIDLDYGWFGDRARKIIETEEVHRVAQAMYDALSRIFGEKYTFEALDAALCSGGLKFELLGSPTRISDVQCGRKNQTRDDFRFLSKKEIGLILRDFRRDAKPKRDVKPMSDSFEFENYDHRKVDAYIAKMDVGAYAEDLEGNIAMPGHVTNGSDACGNYVTLGCIEGRSRINPDPVAEHEGDVRIRKTRYSCGGAGCHHCFQSWMKKEARNMTDRLMAGLFLQKNRVIRDKTRKRVILHFTLSPPPELYDFYRDPETRKTMRRYVMAKLNTVADFEGCAMIDHAYRFSDGLDYAFFEPHFHLLLTGYSEEGRIEAEYARWEKLLYDALLDNSVQDPDYHDFYKLTAVVYHSTVDTELDVYSLSKYLLSHAAVMVGDPLKARKSREHTVRWFGKFGYNNMRVAEIEVNMHQEQQDIAIRDVLQAAAKTGRTVNGGLSSTVTLESIHMSSVACGGVWKEHDRDGCVKLEYEPRNLTDAEYEDLGTYDTFDAASAKLRAVIKDYPAKAKTKFLDSLPAHRRSEAGIFDADDMALERGVIQFRIDLREVTESVDVERQGQIDRMSKGVDMVVKKLEARRAGFLDTVHEYERHIAAYERRDYDVMLHFRESEIRGAIEVRLGEIEALRKKISAIDAEIRGHRGALEDVGRQRGVGGSVVKSKTKSRFVTMYLSHDQAHLCPKCKRRLRHIYVDGDPDKVIGLIDSLPVGDTVSIDSNLDGLEIRDAMDDLRLGDIPAMPFYDDDRGLDYNWVQFHKPDFVGKFGSSVLEKHVLDADWYARRWGERLHNEGEALTRFDALLEMQGMVNPNYAGSRHCRDVGIHAYDPKSGGLVESPMAIQAQQPESVAD